MPILGLLPSNEVDSRGSNQVANRFLYYRAEAKEGEFWKTEDYFEKMVWRNDVEQHGQFFEGGIVEGGVNSERCKELGIVVQEGMDVEVRATLRWAVGAILEALKGGSP